MTTERSIDPATRGAELRGWLEGQAAFRRRGQAPVVVAAAADDMRPV